MGRSHALVNDTEARIGRALLPHASWHMSGFWNSSVRLRWPDPRLPEVVPKGCIARALQLADSSGHTRRSLAVAEPHLFGSDKVTSQAVEFRWINPGH